MSIWIYGKDSFKRIRIKHIAGVREKKLDLVFSSEDIDLFNEIVEEADLHNISYQSVVKE